MHITGREATYENGFIRKDCPPQETDLRIFYTRLTSIFPPEGRRAAQRAAQNKQ